MDEPKTDGRSQPIALAQEPADPELASIKQFLILLDKAAKSSRTYGATNSVAQKFLQQQFEILTDHLGHYSKLACSCNGPHRSPATRTCRSNFVPMASEN